MELLTYWVPITVVGLAAIAAAWLAHRHPDWPWRAVGLGLAALLALCEATWWIRLFGTRPFQPALDLPLQLCDLSAWTAAAALVFRREILYHLTWFWGIGGAIPALFLPVRGAPFPGWFYFEFYLAHGGLIVAAVLIAVAFKVRIRRASLLRAMVVTGAVTLCLGVVDIATGGNYLYLSSLPPVTGPIQALGSWPFYRVALCCVGALVMVLLGWVLRDRESAELPALAAPTQGS